MLKVMHVLKSRQFSGAENVAITIINSTKEQIDSVYVSSDGPIKEYLDENKIHFFPIEKLSYKELKRAIKTIKPDIIHAHDFTAGIMSVITVSTVLSSPKKIPIINHLHNNSPWIRRYGLYSFVYALSCLRYGKILTVSESVMNEYVFGKFFRNKTEVIGNPIDVNRIRHLAQETDMVVIEPKNASETVKKQEVVEAGKAKKSALKAYDISFLGRFSPPKNPLLFLDIVAGVKKTKPDVSVVMIGDGELREDVEKRIRELGLEGNIKLLGFQKNPYKFLKQAKLLLMPSVWEGFGLAAVEALALGLPVVCSGVGGLSKIIDDDCGVICHNQVDYVNAVLAFISNKDLLEKVSNRAYAKSNTYSIEKYSKKILSLYSSQDISACNTEMLYR